MEIIQAIGPDNPVILVREPKLIARNMKQLETMVGEDELFLHPQLILAMYSSQIHLKMCETISFSNLFAFNDGSVYVVIETNIDQCQSAAQAIDQHYSLSSDNESSENMTDFENSFEPDNESDIPNWLKELGCSQGDSSLSHHHVELRLIQPVPAHTIQPRPCDSVLQAIPHPAYEWKQRYCCCILM